MVHYTLPFCSTRLSTMADAFNTSVSELEKDLVALITDNQIQARIDSQNKTLHVRHDENRRNATFRSVLETGKGFIRDVTAMLRRASLLEHEHN
ncbi:COP9 signalosome complex subunit 1-like [Asparagus officinalis]|nr:COP9 signalosome complex subunit 1-like [Asparagus officinalis]